MRKLRMLFAGVALAILLPLPAGAGVQDASGPACSDVVNGSVQYDGADATVTIELATRPCLDGKIIYTALVADDGDDPEAVAQSSSPAQSPDSPKSVTFTVPHTAVDGAVWAWVTTQSAKDLKVYDTTDRFCADADSAIGGVDAPDPLPENCPGGAARMH